MAKTNAAEAEDKQDSGDAPLIDLNEANIKKLIARAKKRGVITYDELNEVRGTRCPTDQIEDIMSALNEMGVNIVESEEGDEEEKEQDDGVEEVDGAGETFIVEKKKETVDRTDDPVRMYLREMGAVELLSREGEIAIAKRIEAGRDTMIWGLCESPITFNAIIDWSTLLNHGVMQLQGNSRPRGDALQGPDRRAGRQRRERDRGRRRSAKRPPARASRKRKSPRRPRPRSPRTTRRTWSSGARRARSRRRTRTTRSPSPRWRRR